MENLRSRVSIWLVNALLNYGKLTFKEINELWKNNEELSEGVEMSRMKLNRLVNTALDMLGIVIECDRRDGYRYYIAANDNVKAAEWLISSHAISQVVTESVHLRDRILLEEIPSGQYHLSSIITAMDKGKALEMVYKKFADSESVTCFIEPYCIKLSQQRWYLLARKDHREYLQVFALDRIQQLRILNDQNFAPPADFSPKEYFADYFGVHTGSKEGPTLIRLYADDFWSKYLRTLPLHATQKEVNQHAYKSGAVFEYLMAATPDLINQLLSYGPGVEVLEPRSLRDRLRDNVRKMDELYKENV